MKLGIWALLGVLAVNPVIATATPNDPNPCGNHGNNCCTEDGGQSYESVETTCTQVVETNPKAYCDSYATAVAAAAVNAKAQSLALAICGDADANCEGGSAFSLAVTKQACLQASVQTAISATECGSASQSCGDASQSCSLECPSCPLPPACPDVTVGTRVMKCAKWKKLRNGREIGRRCFTVTEAVYQQ